MTSYIIRRLLLLVPTLIGITIVTFSIMVLSPGGLRATIANREGGLDPRARVAIRNFYEKKYGLDQPAYVQYLRWLNRVSFVGVKVSSVGWPATRFGFKRPDLGESIAERRPVLDIIEECLPITLLLNAITIPIVMTLSIWSGVLAAKHRGGILDIAGGTTMLGLWSVPQIWAGVLLVGYLANRSNLQWFPTAGLHDLRADEMSFLPNFAGGFHRGWLLDTMWHLVLPVIALSYGGFAFTSKLTRSAMLENIAADYVRTARAKGLDESVILYRHVLRNGLLPLITNFASLLPGLISGSVVVEWIFSLPGMGRLGVDAVFDKDPEMVLSVTLIASILGLLSFLIADVSYVLADPRVSFEAET
ncbi:MAG: ABC transporter permease [Phycisphaerae bacterium]|nr:ABC transporter permease [Phycisphaerae bacterium]